MASEQQPPTPEAVTGTWAAAYPGRFLSAADLGSARPTLTIERIEIEALEGENGLERRVVVSFAGKAKRWIIPKLCSKSLVAMFGERASDSIGKRIVLYATADLMPMRRGEPCLRVWGSPDIDRDVQAVWKPKKRGELRWILHATGPRPQTAVQAPATERPRGGDTAAQDG